MTGNAGKFDTKLRTISKTQQKTRQLTRQLTRYFTGRDSDGLSRIFFVAGLSSLVDREKLKNMGILQKNL